MHPLFVTARIPLDEITRLDAGFPYLRAVTMSGVLQRSPGRQRHYTDQGYSSPKVSTPPSSPVRSAGFGEDLMQRWCRGPEPFLVFAHDHEDLSAIRQGRAFKYFGCISRLSRGDNAARCPREPIASALRPGGILHRSKRRLNEPVIDQALKTILRPTRQLNRHPLYTLARYPVSPPGRI